MLPAPQNPYGPPQGPPPPAKKTPDWLVIMVVLGVGGVVLVGTLAALAIYGVRRYLASAKSSEAKNTIGAIARGARASYERESIRGSDGSAHVLCKSATPVPTSVASGMKYQPRSGGGDFDTGDAETGWRCLRFSMTQPIYYQYHYQQGSGYLTPSARPDPDGFEAAARGDLDGDGDTSLFSISGSAAGGTFTVSPSIYIEDELE
jgi:type IV pilus assembly protein PilA